MLEDYKHYSTGVSRTNAADNLIFSDVFNRGKQIKNCKLFPQCILRTSSVCVMKHILNGFV